WTIVQAESFDVGLSNRALQAVGARLGTKSLQVLAEDDCVIAVLDAVLDFFAGETADQCPVCYRGLPALRQTVARLAEGRLAEEDLEAWLGFVRTLPGRGVCALPDGAARMTRSVLEGFPDHVRRHLSGQDAAS